jgi:hypothetical protein
MLPKTKYISRHCKKTRWEFIKLPEFTQIVNLALKLSCIPFAIQQIMIDMLSKPLYFVIYYSNDLLSLAFSTVSQFSFMISTLFEFSQNQISIL